MSEDRATENVETSGSGRTEGTTDGQSTDGRPGDDRSASGVEPNDEITGPAAGGTGLEPNVAAALAYLFAPLTGVLMLLIEGDDDDFVRFHSLQSIGFGAVVIAVWIAVSIVVGVLTAIPFVGDLFALLAIPLNAAVGLGSLAVWLLLILKAYQGERYALPVIGSFAASN